MNRRIILHVGSPKCGSTYLQQLMLSNSNSLKQHGIHYPHDRGNHPGNAFAIEAITPKALEVLFEGDATCVLISHEDLYSRPKSGLALAKAANCAGVNVQIIAFIRPFSEFIFGDYSQYMKQHFEHYLRSRIPYDGRNFEGFARRRVMGLTPATFLKGWGRVFPQQPLILDSHHNIRTVLKDLLGTGAIANWHVHADKTNRSLRVEDCDRIASAIRDTACDAKQIRDLFKAAFFKTSEPDAGRTSERISLIEQLFETQNQTLRANFNYDNSPADLLSVKA